MKAIIIYKYKGDEKKDLYDFSHMQFQPQIGGLAQRFHQRMQLRKFCYEANGINITSYESRLAPSDYQLISIELVHYNEHATEVGRMLHDDFKDMATPTITTKKRCPRQQTEEMDLDDERK